MYLNSDQLAYIDKLRSEGSTFNAETLRVFLTEHGWPDFEVEEAVNRYIAVETNIVQPEVSKIKVEADELNNVFNKLSPTSNPAVVFGGVGVLVVILLVCVYLYMSQSLINKSTILTNENLLSNIYEKIADIETTNYKFDFSLVVKDRSEGALSYGEMFPLSEAELDMYKRDQDRIRDISKIKNELDKFKPNYSYYTSTSTQTEPAKYPAKLSDIGISFSDPLSGLYKYTPTSNFESYSIEVTLETNEAYNALRFSQPIYSDDVSEGIDKKMVTITPESYIYSYGFSGRPAQPKLFGVFDISDIEEFLPKDIVVNFNLGGSVDKSSDKPVNAQLSVGGDVTFGDANFAFAAEGRKIDTNYYGILNKVPTFFSSLSQLRGKWVAFNEADLRNYGYGDFYDNYIPSEDNERKRAMKEVGGWLTKTLQTAEKFQVVKIATGPEADEKYGKGTVRYSLKFDKNKVHDFVSEVIASLDGTEYSLSEREKSEILDYLKGEEFDKSFDYLSNNITFSVWFDKNGYPVRVEQMVRYIPSPDALALNNSQIEITYSVNLADINKSLNLQVPEKTITFDELMTEVTGLTIEEVMINRQESNIRNIKWALESYYGWSGRYPFALEELKKSRGEVEKNNAIATSSNSFYSYSNSNDDYYREIPFLRSLPDDVYKKEMYTYRQNGDDFELKYEIRQVPYTKDKNPRNYYKYVYEYSNDLYTRETTSYLTLPKYVDGINTATKLQDSKEAESDKKDTDGDGLVDSLELIFGTDKNKIDTDGDGYSDKEEIMIDSNPTGPGKLEYNRGSGFF